MIVAIWYARHVHTYIYPRGEDMTNAQVIHTVCSSCKKEETEIYNCALCRDYGVIPAKASRECLVVCSACNAPPRFEYHEMHRVFDTSVPDHMIGVLNDAHGILYNNFLLGERPPKFCGPVPPIEKPQTLGELMARQSSGR